MSDEFEHEPIPGLPQELPAGETLLWQGSPGWWALTRRALHAGAAIAYIAIFAIWSFASDLYDGAGAAEAFASGSRVALAGAVGIALLAYLGVLIARNTIFTLTDKRLVMRFGVALPMAINIPYSLIGSADLNLHADGTGDIALATEGGKRIGYSTLWPYVRPWHLNNPQPLLRCVPDAHRVATILANALAQAHGTVAQPVARPQRAAEAALPDRGPEAAAAA